MKSNKAFQVPIVSGLSDEIIYLLFECYPKRLKEVDILWILCLFPSERIKKELKSLEGDYIQKYNDRYKLTPYWYRKLAEFLLG